MAIVKPDVYDDLVVTLECSADNVRWQRPNDTVEKAPAGLSTTGTIGAQGRDRSPTLAYVRMRIKLDEEGRVRKLIRR